MALCKAQWLACTPPRTKVSSPSLSQTSRRGRALPIVPCPMRKRMIESYQGGCLRHPIALDQGESELIQKLSSLEDCEPLRRSRSRPSNRTLGAHRQRFRIDKPTARSSPGTSDGKLRSRFAKESKHTWHGNEQGDALAANQTDNSRSSIEPATSRGTTNITRSPERITRRSSSAANLPAS